MLFKVRTCPADVAFALANVVLPSGAMSETWPSSAREIPARENQPSHCCWDRQALPGSVLRGEERPLIQFARNGDLAWRRCADGQRTAVRRLLHRTDDCPVDLRSAGIEL